MPEHRRNPPSTVTLQWAHSICGAATFPSTYKLHWCRRSLSSWYSLCEEPYHPTQTHHFQWAIATCRSQCQKMSAFLIFLFALLIEMLQISQYSDTCALLSSAFQVFTHFLLLYDVRKCALYTITGLLLQVSPDMHFSGENCCFPAFLLRAQSKSLLATSLSDKLSIPENLNRYGNQLYKDASPLEELQTIVH